MKKIIQVICIVVFALLCGKSNMYAQTKAKQQYVTIESVVKDAQGAPVSGAKIYGKEGITIVKTDANGHFSINVPAETKLLVECDGFESKVLSQKEVKSGVVLNPTPYRYGEKDNVKIGFGTSKRGDLIGNISVVEPDDIIKYDNSQNVSDALNCRIPGLIGTNQIHYLGDALVVLDGIPRYDNMSAVNISMEEVDQITVLKDINAVALYGSQARNGVIIITTKRGKANKRDLNVSFYQGISKPKATPQYLNSADYMELYNEARTNDGLTKLYDDATIANYRTGNPLRYPSNDYYSSDYIKPFNNYTKLLTEFSGGNDNATFYANFGWAKDGSLMDFGPNKDLGSNRFNARANVDFRINSFITSRLDVGTIFNFNKSNRGNYWADASTIRPNLYTPLLPLSLISSYSNPTLANLITGRKNDVDGTYLLGGTAQNQTTSFGDVYSGGYNQSVNRTLQFNNAIDFDLGMITKGLSLKTNISFDFYNYYNQSIANTYAVYQPTWSSTNDSIVGLTKYGTDTKASVQSVGSPDFLRRMGFFAQLDYLRTFTNVHNVNATLIGFYNTVKENGTFQPFKHAHVGLRLNYNYDHIFYADFSGAYVNSAKLAPGNRGAFSPTLSIATELKKLLFADVSSVDYLKVKASAGIINTDISMPNYFLYDNKYANSGSYNWSDNSYRNNGIASQYGPNSSLTFEKRKEINLGFEGQFFKRSLTIEANYFTTRLSDKTSFRNDAYPTFFANFVPYENYEEDAINGLELGITGSKKMGDFGIDLGIKGMYWNSKAITRDEIHAFDYQYRAGRSTDASFGLVADGLFKDQADIQSHAIQTFGEVRPGDIKYVDQNNDGFIDANDQVKIGRSNYPVSVGLELKLSYKRFTFFAIGNARSGANGYKNNNYYWVDGADKYSTQVLNRWTSATAQTATFPRLTSLASSNNYRQSTYWMYKNNYFQILRMQLTYDLPESICKKAAMKNLSVSLGGANFLTFSKVKDIRDLNVGSAPQNSYFSLGIRSTF